MSVLVTGLKKKRCYLCKRGFEPYNLTIPKKVSKGEDKQIHFKLDTYSNKGRLVELCPSCKIQKFINLGETLSKAKYSINRTVLVKITSEE